MRRHLRAADRSEGRPAARRYRQDCPGLYAKGITVRDIQAHLAEIYDVDVSPDVISKITDAAHAEVAEWQSRPLDAVYPVIFLDAIVCKLRDGGSVKNKAAHLAVGVHVEGRKEVLGIWVETTEGAKFWLRVLVARFRDGDGVARLRTPPTLCDAATPLLARPVRAGVSRLWRHVAGRC